MTHSILTIGHSTKPVESFIGMLQAHAVTAVADVRSSPFSRYNPQFNRDALRTSLANDGIQYVLLGQELGARSDDPACYVGGKVQYQRLAATPLFQAGLDRVEQGAAQYRVALMCAEKEPLECHRTILVARHLVMRGHEIAHILPDGTLEPHAHAMLRLLDQLGLSAQDMFRSQDDILDEAYARQGEKIAYDRIADETVKESRVP
ncbi:MAG: DUF488 family protein [Gammaproteobacteria bacterium]